MAKQVTTRTTTTVVTVQDQRTFPVKRTLKQAAGAAILIGIGIVAAR